MWGWNAFDIPTFWISRNWRVLSFKSISNAILFIVIAKVWTTTCWSWGSNARINERVSQKSNFKFSISPIFEIFSTKESTAKLSNEKKIFVCDVRTIPIILSHPRLHQFSMMKMVISNNYDQEKNPHVALWFSDRRFKGLDEVRGFLIRQTSQSIFSFHLVIPAHIKLDIHSSQFQQMGCKI